jgi:hypothetical protein
MYTTGKMEEKRKHARDFKLLNFYGLCAIFLSVTESGFGAAKLRYRYTTLLSMQNTYREYYRCIPTELNPDRLKTCRHSLTFVKWVGGEVSITIRLDKKLTNFTTHVYFIYCIVIYLFVYFRPRQAVRIQRVSPEQR